MRTIWLKNNNDGKACTNQMKTWSCDIDLYPSASNVPAATSRKHPWPTSDVRACDEFIWHRRHGFETTEWNEWNERDSASRISKISAAELRICRTMSHGSGFAWYNVTNVNRTVENHRINKLLNASKNHTSIAPKQLRQHKWKNWYLKSIFKWSIFILALLFMPILSFSCWYMLKYCLAHEQIEEKHYILTEGAWRWKKPKDCEIQTGPASTTWLDCCKTCLDDVHQAAATPSSLRMSKSWLWQLVAQRVTWTRNKHLFSSHALESGSGLRNTSLADATHVGRSSSEIA